MKEKRKSLLSRAYLAGTAAVAVAVLVSATYAWFSSSTKVSTDTASARSGSGELELQISTDGSNFQATDGIAIAQVNQTNAESLIPVSTADLQNFVYNPSTNGENASIFKLVENEQYYYHGRIYLRAYAQGDAADAKLQLYLDEDSQSGGQIAQNTDGMLLNAARLGLRFDDGSAGSVIFALSDSSNPAGSQTRNTYVNGQQLSDGQVLSWNGSGAVAAADPAQSLSDYTITETDTSISLPQNMLLEMEPGRSYPVDIYFYLEGCDPDCSDDIS